MENLTGSGGRNAANFLLYFAVPLRLARTTHRNGGSANTSAHAKRHPLLGRRLVGRGGDLTGSGGRNAANFLLCFAFSLRLARTTHRNGGSVNTSAHAKRHPFGVPSGGQRWRPHRFGRSQRRKLFTLFCRTAAACSYEPPKRRFGEHLCPRKTAPPLGRRLVGRGGDLTGSEGRNAANFLLYFAVPLRLARTNHRNGGSANTSAHANGTPFGVPSGGQRWIRTTEVCDVRFTV